MTEDEMVEWLQQLNAHEFEQTPGDGEGQGSLACCSPWGHKESDMTEKLNNNRGPQPVPQPSRAGQRRAAPPHAHLGHVLVHPPGGLMPGCRAT